jgi:hypothetical protein
MRTINRTFSIEQEASEYLDLRKAEDSKFSASQFISEIILALAAKEKIKTQAKLIQCSVCKVEYADILRNCPNCQATSIKESEKSEKDALEALNQTRAIAEQAEQEAIQTAKKVKWLKLKEVLETNLEIFKALNEFKEKNPSIDDFSDFVGDYRNAEIKYEERNLTNYDILNFFRGKEKYGV